MASHSGTVSTSDNKSILSVTDSEIENVVSFFKDYMINNTPKEFKLNNPKINLSNTIIILDNEHGNTDLRVGIGHSCVLINKYSRSGDGTEENPYVYTLDNSGTYTNVTGEYGLISELDTSKRYSLSNSQYSQSNSGDYYAVHEGLAIVYDDRQMLFQNDNTILTRIYNSSWGNWIEVVTDANLMNKVSSNFSSTTKLQDLGLLDLIYPVGSIYISQNKEFNPATKFGGTWTPIVNRFLYGIDALDENSDFSTGGNNTAILTINNLPKIEGQFYIRNTRGDNDTIFDSDGVFTANQKEVWGEGPHDELQPVQVTQENTPYRQKVNFVINNNGAQAFSIMPPYQEVYMWKRTS